MMVTLWAVPVDREMPSGAFCFGEGVIYDLKHGRKWNPTRVSICGEGFNLKNISQEGGVIMEGIKEFSHMVGGKQLGELQCLNHRIQAIAEVIYLINPKDFPNSGINVYDDFGKIIHSGSLKIEKILDEIEETPEPEAPTK